MSRFIDRRLNGKHKSAVNRQRFLQRFKKQLKVAVEEAVKNRSITDIEKSESINIPAKDVREYQFRHGSGGTVKSVLPGNKNFIEGDKIPKPTQESQGVGNQASNTGEGIDDFIFELTSEEFLDIFFDDLELPDLIKKQLATVKTVKFIRSGYSTTGIPTNINVIRSLKGATARRIALTSPYLHELYELEQKLEEIDKNEIDIDIEKSNSYYHDILVKIETLKKKIHSIPFIDTFDLRYNNRIKQAVPTTQAVMFCIMDVSGSMDKSKKEIAKRFFILLYLFLKRNYAKVNVVFIRHHTTAKEVDEKEFFFSRETGGTVVSSALNLVYDIIKERYDPLAWNIYAAQASDGDNWNADSPLCGQIIKQKIIPFIQYFAYVEIMPRLHQSLWEEYLSIKQQHKNFAMETIASYKDIYPVFRQLFKKQIT